MAARVAGTNGADTRKMILSAAETLFAEKGFDGAGIDEISRKAGITKSVIYYHFRNKDDIRQSIIDRFIDDTMKLKEQTGQEAILEPVVLREGISRLTQFLHERENAVKILMMQTMVSSDANPLLDFWDRNNEIARRFRKILFDEPESSHRKDNFIGAFFLTLVPVFSYFAFADGWCEHYGISRGEADRMFEESLTHLYQNFTTSEYGLDKILKDNMK